MLGEKPNRGVVGCRHDPLGVAVGPVAPKRHTPCGRSGKARAPNSTTPVEEVRLRSASRDAAGRRATPGGGTRWPAARRRRETRPALGLSVVAVVGWRILAAEDPVDSQVSQVDHRNVDAPGTASLAALVDGGRVASTQGNIEAGRRGVEAQTCHCLVGFPLTSRAREAAGGHPVRAARPRWVANITTEPVDLGMQRNEVQELVVTRCGDCDTGFENRGPVVADRRAVERRTGGCRTSRRWSGRSRRRHPYPPAPRIGTRPQLRNRR